MSQNFNQFYFFLILFAELSPLQPAPLLHCVWEEQWSSALCFDLKLHRCMKFLLVPVPSDLIWSLSAYLCYWCNVMYISKNEEKKMILLFWEGRKSWIGQEQYISGMHACMVSVFWCLREYKFSEMYTFVYKEEKSIKSFLIFFQKKLAVTVVASLFVTFKEF